MKPFLRSLTLIAALLLGAIPFTYAQEPVSTGMIAGYQPKEGTLTIRSDQTQGLITFFGVDKANIFSADGKPMLMTNLTLGARVTVQYAERDNRWYVSKVVLPAEPPPTRLPATVPQSLPLNDDPLERRYDNDITRHSDVQRGRVEALMWR